MPGTELRLGRMRDGAHEHRPGVDITLSAPKSVSLEALLPGRGNARALRAHNAAVRATLDFIETRLLKTRRWDRILGRSVQVQAPCLVAATFRHVTSRNKGGRWLEVDASKRFRYVNWIRAHSIHEARSAPPLRMRLRCWYEIVIETNAGKRIVLREEGLRGDDARTGSRAIGRWRQSGAHERNELVAVREIRIAKRQPRPMPREDARTIG